VRTALALVAVSTATLLPLAPAHAATCNVTVQLAGYNPGTYQVAPGQNVHWCWNEGNHSVTSNTGAFNSGVLDSGATFDHAFATAGTYTYHCSVHGSMVATIVVKAAATPSPTHTTPPHTTTPPAPKPSTTAPRPVTTTTRPPARTPAPTASPTPSRTATPARTTAPTTTTASTSPPEAAAEPTVTTSPLAGAPRGKAFPAVPVALGAAVVFAAGALYALRGRTSR
jgi:plastocyanin